MEKYLPILRSCPFFMGLKDTEILSILHCVNAVKVSKASRSYIFKAGDSTEVMGLVLAGSTLIIQEDLWGHRNILSKCNAGDFFGEPYAAAGFRRFPGTRGALKRIPEKRRGKGGLFRPSQALQRLRIALMILFLNFPQEGDNQHEPAV